MGERTAEEEEEEESAENQRRTDKEGVGCSVQHYV